MGVLKSPHVVRVLPFRFGLNFFKPGGGYSLSSIECRCAGLIRSRFSLFARMRNEDMQLDRGHGLGGTIATRHGRACHSRDREQLQGPYSELPVTFDL